MKRDKRGRWVALGLVAGAIASYAAARAYVTAKNNCPPFRKNVYKDNRDLIGAFKDFWQNPAYLSSMRGNRRIDHPFAEKVMLAVIGVNGGGSYARAHRSYAMEQGLDRDEIESLLRGEVGYATVDEAPGLFFARHYAAQQGEPDPDLVERLVDAYGKRTARDIITYTRLLISANLIGNTFDALISRILGHPSPSTTLKSELATLALFTFGIMPLVPLLMLRAVWSSEC